MFDEYVASIKKTWGHNRNESIGASEVFGCLRQAYFKKFGEEEGFKKDPDATDSWGATTRGDIIENHFIVPALTSQMPKGVEALYMGEDQQTIISGDNSATPDGLLAGLSKDALKLYGVDDIESDCILTEFKSIDPRVNLTEAKPIHVGQVQQQLGLIRKKTEFRPVYGVIIYVNASFMDDIKVFVVKFDPAAWRAAIKRGQDLFDARHPSELPAEGKISGGCDHCQFKMACSEINFEQIPDKKTNENLSEADLDDLYDLALKAEAAKRDEEEAKEEKERLRAVLKQKMATAETRFVKEHRFKLAWSGQAGRKSVDLDAVRAAGIDLTPFEKTGASHERFTITIEGKNN